MRLRFVQGTKFAALVVILLVVCGGLFGPTGFSAQAPAGAGLPRTPEGRPDLSGIWQVMNTAEYDVEDHQAREGVPAGVGVVEGGEIPYKPEAVAKRKENFANRATADPVSKCWMPGVPRVTYMPFPFQIMQMSDQLAIFYEFAYTTRYIYTNGTPHPKGHIDWYMGDSRAKWEGDTLVADVVDFNDLNWLDKSGNYHSEELHVVERYTMTDRDHITYEVTLEDPKVYTKPWKMRMVLYRHTEPNFRVLEYVCHGFKLEDYYPYPQVSGAPK